MCFTCDECVIRAIHVLKTKCALRAMNVLVCAGVLPDRDGQRRRRGRVPLTPLLCALNVFYKQTKCVLRAIKVLIARATHLIYF